MRNRSPPGHDKAYEGDTRERCTPDSMMFNPPQVCGSAAVSRPPPYGSGRHYRVPRRGSQRGRVGCRQSRRLVARVVEEQLLALHGGDGADKKGALPPRPALLDEEMQ